MHLHRILEQTAIRHPENEAVVCDDRRLTYGEWDRRINRVANDLAGRGVASGDRVGILTRNRIEQATTYLATNKLGAVPVPMNFRLSPDDLVHIVTAAETKALLYDEAVSELVSGVEAELTPVEHYFSTGGSPAVGEPFETFGERAPETPPDGSGVEVTDLAVMMHTSGTTGRPKLVETDHRSVWANAMACGVELDFGPSDRALHFAPMFHSADYFNLFVPSVLVGATNVMQPFFDATAALDVIQEEEITLTLGAPTHFRRMKDDGVADRDLSSLRAIVSSGAPIPDDVAEWIAGALCERFYNVYGLTETTGLVTIRDPNEPAALADHYCIGRPFLNVDVRLVELGDDVPPSKTVERGERGRLVTRAPKLMHGYYGQPEKTARTLHGEWLYTNDLVLQGDDDRYYLVDRIDNAITSGGETIYPLEVELTLRRHRSVEECAVTGEADEELGERVVAYVVASDDSLSAADIERFWREDQTAVADYKRPRDVYFVPELPDEV